MRKRSKEPYRRPAVRALASRAIFNEASGQLPTIAMKFEMTDGEIVEFELNITEAAKFIEQSVAAYHAVVPNLKIGRSPFIG
jgi:hypothetical protein